VNPTVLAVVLIVVSVLLLAAGLVDIRQWNTIRELRAKVLLLEIVADKRRRTVREQARMLVEMNDRNERLHEDNRRMRERLPALAVDEDVTRPYVRKPQRGLARSRVLGHDTDGSEQP